MLKNKLSICLATYNEEKNLERCLRSIKDLAWEIIIVDGYSQDKTIKIGKKFKAKIIEVSNKTMFLSNRQLAIDKARGDWILVLDADEEATPKLREEIRSTINGKSEPKRHLPGEICRHLGGGEINGCYIPRKNIIFGKWIKHTGWWPDYQLRLFKKGKASHQCFSIHEKPTLQGKSANLINPIIHHNYQNISQFLKKLDLYTTNDKNIMLQEGKRVCWQDALLMPGKEFIRRFLFWEGYKDGLHGLVLSIFQSFYQFVVFAKLWEAKSFKEEEIDKDKVKKIFHDKLKEYRWWEIELIINPPVDGQKSPAGRDPVRLKTCREKIKKLTLKLLRKIKTRC